MPTCKRCGMKYARITVMHTRACDVLPRPGELARIYLDNPGMTLNQLGEHFNANYHFIRDRMMAGCHEVGMTRDELQAIINRRRDAAQIKAGSKPKKIKNQCRRCRVNLDHPLVPRSGDICLWCRLEKGEVMAVAGD